MIDADGTVLGLYRKSHIPDGPGYQEKYYFTPGDTGFKVWQTRFGAFGAAICWDQWFPESARVMALMGAEALFYPTAIGSEPPPAPPVDSRDHWRRVMQGHAAANFMPLIASNRIGMEKGQAGEITFYGSSFIADPQGAIAAELGRTEEGVATATFDLDDIAKARASWGLFRDRRPELYGPIVSHDGSPNDANILVVAAVLEPPRADAAPSICLIVQFPVAGGRTVLEFRDACSGWTTTQRFIADMTDAKGEDAHTDFIVSSSEDKDGKIIRFKIRNLVNGRRRSASRASARWRRPAAKCA